MADKFWNGIYWQNKSDIEGIPPSYWLKVIGVIMFGWLAIMFIFCAVFCG